MEPANLSVFVKSERASAAMSSGANQSVGGESQ